ncbi:uncharacterized protein LOC123549947 [Mercenaria mercenaria]|uniref:uncharacterized protein LOC123549947 n=1 Tax=Mercenaria mercenaria TaxID=6596 RepID=UPI00234EC2CE|nr:uncharacterized protein LOC123549947 [Mercenaria mercenaria]
MPRELMECVRLNKNENGVPGSPYNTTDDIHTHCLQLFLWKAENVQWSDFNITQKDRDFINSLVGSFVRRGRTRTKRQTGPGGPMRRGRIFPQTGFRVRREYRRLSDPERFAFHAAINQMKMSGQYNTFANLHQGMVVTSAHNGPNFFGWHRVYVALVEEALRRINRRLSLPYWDSTLDFNMMNPANSIIWSTPFLGNGDGFVTTGPFANWETPVGRLTRNVGGGSRLFSTEVIRAIMTRCRIREISEPTAQPQFNLELAHGGPHVWVGGQMSGLNTAAHDPVFFLHHAFVDYIWEMFRMRQARFCGVNPSRDYPPAMGEHAAQRPMDGFPQYRNIDGYRAYWTRFWYRYERSPTCARWRPFCGTPYLRCDIGRQRCVSVARRVTAAPAGIAGARAVAFGGRNQPQTMASSLRARAQESTVRIGPRFRAPPAEPRTLDARIGMTGRRFRRGVNQTKEKKADTTDKLKTNKPSKANIGPLFAAPPSDGRTSDILGDASVGGVIGFDPIAESALAGGFLFPEAEPQPLLPSSEFQTTATNDMLREPLRNTFTLDGQTNINNWSFIPVRVIYTNDQQSRFQNLPEFNNPYSPYHSPLDSSKVPDVERCIQDPSGAIQVRVQSSGLNYYGTFSDYALINTHLPVDSAITFIGIKSPSNSTSELILTAVHSCGLMCQALCLIPNSNPRVFKSCNGVLRVAANDPSLYGNNYKEAIANAWKGTQFKNPFTENVRVVFHCSSTDISPWIPNSVKQTSKSAAVA